MNTREKHQPADHSEASLFPPTQWTVLLKPLHDRAPGEKEALERLFEIYRKPILRYILFHEKDPNNAEDMTHDFIVKLLRHGDIARLDRSKGSFRSFLLTAIKNFLVTAHRADRALKRGGRWIHVPIEAL
jgi:DNA-directed RNA polymerase specialized sigma24 family protein